MIWLRYIQEPTDLPESRSIAHGPRISTGGFIIKNFECVFVVFVSLNRGYRYGKAQKDSAEKGRRTPDFYVFPVDIAKAALYKKSRWGKAFVSHIDRVDDYKGDWQLVRSFLETEARHDVVTP